MEYVKSSGSQYMDFNWNDTKYQTVIGFCHIDEPVVPDESDEESGLCKVCKEVQERDSGKRLFIGWVKVFLNSEYYQAMNKGMLISKLKPVYECHFIDTKDWPDFDEEHRYLCLETGSRHPAASCFADDWKKKQQE